MKKLILIAAIFTLLFTIKAEANTPAPAQFGIFYTSLSPHGSWLEIEPGFVVWRPTIMKRWSPYRDGRWVWTSHGWYWDSYEPFGHITYHYGRWYYDDYYGWIWVPDYEWAPAWVEWRYDDDYIGWAPLPPYATFSIGVGIVFTNTYYNPYGHWHYVGYNHFYDPHPYNYYVTEKVKYRIHSKTKYRSDYDYRNGSVYNRGVDYELVRKRSGREISRRDVIRTSDYNDLRNNGGRNDGAIRTFSPSRDDLRKEGNDLRNAKVERSDRKSSLLTSKVQIGDRQNRNASGTQNRNDVEVRKQTDLRKNNSEAAPNREKGSVGSRNQNQPEAKVNRQSEAQTQRKSDANVNRQSEVRTQKQNEVKRQSETRNQNEVKRDNRTEVNRQPKQNTAPKQESRVIEQKRQEVKSGNNVRTQPAPNQQRQKVQPDVRRSEDKRSPSVQPEVRRNNDRQTEIKRNNDRQIEVKRNTSGNNERQAPKENTPKKRR
jgi:hypothetical protein